MMQRHATYMYENSYWSHCQIPSGKTLWFAYICWLLGLALNHFIPILSSYLAACRIPDTASCAGNNSPTLHPTTWNLSTDRRPRLNFWILCCFILWSQECLMYYMYIYYIALHFTTFGNILKSMVKRQDNPSKTIR